ncbi:ABC transporter, partial [Corynebacterium tuscaniense]
LRGAAYVFADEPTASLDPTNRDQVIALLRRAADGGALVLAATHDAAVIAAADSTLRINDRQVTVSGSARD